MTEKLSNYSMREIQTVPYSYEMLYGRVMVLSDQRLQSYSNVFTWNPHSKRPRNHDMFTYQCTLLLNLVMVNRKRCIVGFTISCFFINGFMDKQKELRVHTVYKTSIVDIQHTKSQEILKHLLIKTKIQKLCVDITPCVMR